jgi:ABC-type amino acid transport substrate-binding protein
MSSEPLAVGQKVQHVPVRSNPAYVAAMGTGEIVAITGTRVRVKWENVQQARNYKAENLTVASPHLPQQARMEARLIT